ncbi:CHRD domain-containing protein [Phytoactinopolyspora endophytica]|uniref:CHRD domain-containing protein n=1 Tax=Phytoactinopolyspora endophytica TaxID=1642495 RepID=UPI00101B91E0|nr:CHRD domain-containing protein [Phytoactinopolyspora endophytica]
MRTLTTLGAAALTLGAVLGSGMASAAPAIPLNGAQEAGPGDNDGHGFFTYDLDGTSFCWTLSWDRIDTATAAHVHEGPRHVAGDIVIPLDVGDGSGSLVEGCAEIDEALAADIAENPKAYYANVHNEQFPAGAIRGQLK